MSIVPISELSEADVCLLGHNVRPAPGARPSPGRARLRNRRVLAAVNRSLAALRERVGRLDPVTQDRPGNMRGS